MVKSPKPSQQIRSHDLSSAIASAFHKADTFHRDVSKGNVMMTENQSDVREPWGVLNDWDQARGVDAEPHGRTVRVT